MGCRCPIAAYKHNGYSTELKVPLHRLWNPVKPSVSRQSPLMPVYYRNCLAVGLLCFRVCRVSKVNTPCCITAISCMGCCCCCCSLLSDGLVIFVLLAHLVSSCYERRTSVVWPDCLPACRGRRRHSSLILISALHGGASAWDTDASS